MLFLFQFINIGAHAGRVRGDDRSDALAVVDLRRVTEDYRKLALLSLLSTSHFIELLQTGMWGFGVLGFWGFG
ncbi:MAG: hypothetical protein ACKO96_09650, partial [Flammeovirgaceae bacterium]